MNFRLVIILILGLAIALMTACSNNEGQDTEPGITVSKNEALLAPDQYVIQSAYAINPPLGFRAAPDSVLTIIRDNIAGQHPQGNPINLLNCFLDTAHYAGMLVTEIEGLNVTTDTAQFLFQYRESFYEIFGIANVREDNFSVGPVFIKHFRMADSSSVHLKMLCFHGVDNAVEINYFCPAIYYNDLAGSFESSIASIATLEKAL